ncbi:MAG TPA: hypothetical protein DC042_13520 [Bacteroidales bacterium]|nr:hypothetical protein [Bacteroidales bacterium]
MQIPLQQFENYIDEPILKRGLSYFRKGAVNEVEEISPGQFEAIVSGNDDYTVHVQISGGIITEHWCDCPYDLGPVCKHVVAVLFHMQQEEMDLNQPRKKKPSVGKPLKKKTVEEQARELLGKLSHDDLIQFTLDQCVSNPSFRQIFISEFAHLVSDESKETYKHQIRSYIASIGKRQGYIDWSGAAAIGQSVDHLLLTAQKHLDQSHYQSTVYIACAIMEEMTPLLQYADDSDGAIGGPIEEAFDLLHQVVQSQIPDSLRSELLEYCLATFDKNIYRDWDWHLGLVDLASALVRTEAEGNKVFARMDKSKGSSYTLERVQLIKWDLLLKVKGSEEAEKFLLENLANSGLRTIAIETAIKDKNFEKAIGYAKDGIRFDAKDKPGLVYIWYDWLLKIATIRKDTDRIIEYARILFVESHHHREEYYFLLKRMISPDSWNQFVEGILTDLEKNSRWYPSDIIAGIFINEKWWDRLFGLLKREPSLHTIETYEKHLASGYAKELVELYADAIIRHLVNSSSRNQYQVACRYLRRMKKLGGNDQCNELIRRFRLEYPRRSALLEELSRV